MLNIGYDCNRFCNLINIDTLIFDKNGMLGTPFGAFTGRLRQG
jgi:hypothetical protein